MGASSDQVLLKKVFHSRPGLQTEIAGKVIWGRGCGWFEHPMIVASTSWLGLGQRGETQGTIKVGNIVMCVCTVQQELLAILHGEQRKCEGTLVTSGREEEQLHAKLAKLEKVPFSSVMELRSAH